MKKISAECFYFAILPLFFFLIKFIKKKTTWFLISREKEREIVCVHHYLINAKLAIFNLFLVSFHHFNILFFRKRQQIDLIFSFYNKTTEKEIFVVVI